MKDGLDTMFRNIAEMALEHYETRGDEDFFARYSQVLHALSIDTGVHYQIVCSRMKTYVDALQEPTDRVASLPARSGLRNRDFSSQP